MKIKLAKLISIVGLAVLVSNSCFSQEARTGQVPEQEAIALPKGSLWTRPGADWPGFLGLDGDGKSSETGILKDWSDGKLRLIWKRETGTGYSMGSVADGRFYHFGLIDSKATLICVNAQTGKDLSLIHI